MLIADMIREYQIAEEAFEDKKGELVHELNTILEMLPFKIYGEDYERINHFIVDEEGKVRIYWDF